MASGRCKAKGLTIDFLKHHLENPEVSVIDMIGQDAMFIFIEGLKNGRCPINLKIKLPTLDYAYLNPNPTDQYSINNYAQKLNQALESPNCSHGLQLTVETPTNLQEKNEGGVYSTILVDEWKLSDKLMKGKQDRQNITKKIDQIKSKIDHIFLTELDRLAESKSPDAKKRGDNLTAFKVEMGKFFEKQKIKIQNETESNETYLWRENLNKDLNEIIQKTLTDSSLKKDIGYYQKIAIQVLNVFMAIAFPFAGLKYALTGASFFSTVGKSYETVEQLQDIAKKMK